MLPEKLYKGKQWLPNLAIAAIVVLVGLASFGLGRLSAPPEAQQEGGALLSGSIQP